MILQDKTQIMVNAKARQKDIKIEYRSKPKDGREASHQIIPNLSELLLKLPKKINIIRKKRNTRLKD